MTAASGIPPESPGGDLLTGRQDDIARALRERLPPCTVTVKEQGGGKYTVTLPPWAARELGVGTGSLIPEWRLSGELGVQAAISGPVRRTTPAGEREATFTVTLSL